MTTPNYATPNDQPRPTPDRQLNPDVHWELEVGSGWMLGVGAWEFESALNRSVTLFERREDAIHGRLHFAVGQRAVRRAERESQ